MTEEKSPRIIRLEQKVEVISEGKLAVGAAELARVPRFPDNPHNGGKRSVFRVQLKHTSNGRPLGGGPFNVDRDLTNPSMSRALLDRLLEEIPADLVAERYKSRPTYRPPRLKR